MKKSLQLAVCIAFLLCLFVSCTDEPLTDIHSGTLSAELSGADSAVAYRISGHFSDRASTSFDKTFNDRNLTVSDLMPGEWIITVEAFDSDGKLIAKSESKTVKVVRNAIRKTEILLNRIRIDIPVSNTFRCDQRLIFHTMEEGTEIYYSIDGADFEKYPEAGLDLSVIAADKSTLTIETYAVKEGYEKSDTVAYTYLIDHELECEYTWEGSDADGYSCTGRRKCSVHPLYITDEEEAAVAKTVTDPTCTEEGNSSYKAVFTKDCFETQTKDVVIARKAHSYSEIADDEFLLSAAACNSKAVYYKSCSICGFKSSETFEYGDVAGHDFAEIIDDAYLKVAANCDDDAIYYKSCRTCGEKSDDYFRARGTALGDDLQEIISERTLYKEATCTSAALYRMSCSRCGYISNKTFSVGEPLGHDFDPSIYACTRCGLFMKGPTGGYVFYDCDADNDSGNADGLISSECGWRFIEAAPEDLPDTYVFGYYRTDGVTNLKVEGTSYSIGTAKDNTIRLYEVMRDTVYTTMNGSETTDNYAAKAALEYSIAVDGVTYDEWYLPSYYEVNRMFENLKSNNLGDFKRNCWYWSSSENNYIAAFRVMTPTYTYGTDKSYKAYVRPIRYFI